MIRPNEAKGRRVGAEGQGGKCSGRAGEAEGATAKHGGSEEACHDGLGLNVKISIHFVGAPAPDEADAVTIYPGAEKGHGAAGARGPDGDVGDGVGGVRVGDNGDTNAGRKSGSSNVSTKQGTSFCCPYMR